MTTCIPYGVRGLAVLLLLGAGAHAPAVGPDPVPADPPSTVLLTADSREVTLVGAARAGEATGTPERATEALKNFGQPAAQVVNLGTSGKDNLTEARAEFAPSFARSGHYDVYLYALKIALPGQTRTPVEVIHEGGHKSLSLERHLGCVWAFLGTYPFAVGSSGKVVVDIKGTKGSVAIAGVKFVPVAEPSEALASRPKVLPVASGAPDEFDKLRVQFAENATPAHDADLSDPMVADKVAQEGASAWYYWKTMQRGEGIRDLWTDIPVGKPIEKNEGGGGQLVFQFRRLVQMAQAYVGSNAPLGFAAKMQGNPELVKDILWGLNWLYENRYNERSRNKLGAEWIAMEVNVPISICSAILLIQPQVPKEFINKEVASIEKICPGPDKFYGGSVSTGSNRLLGTYAHALRAILTKTPANLQAVEGLIAEAYRVNRRSDMASVKGKPSFDGYYEDGSFIQHQAFPYIGIYGRGLVERYGLLRNLLRGSPWQLKPAGAEVFQQWVSRGYAPLFFQGEIMFGSLGRSTGQSWHQNGAVSSEILNALVPLAEGAEAENRARIFSVLKTWLVEKENAPYPEFSRLEPERISFDNLAVLAQIRKDPSLPLVHPREGTWVYYSTDYVVHHRKDFAVQLRMFSTRIKSHEDINEGTNKRGWYQGDGTLFLYDRDNSRYNDHFWATVNPYRLAGITVNPRPREAEGSKDGQYSTSPWAGGVELDSFGLASMGLAAVEGHLTGKKAWFFFKDQVICLGSDITSIDHRPIETIVENAKLHGEGKNAFLVNGQAQPVALGWQADLKEVKWAHLAGTVPGTDIGWVFPGGAALKALREARTGNWKDSFINDRDIVDYTRNFLALWFDHGPDPSGAAYAYVLLPGKSVEQVKAWSDAPPVQVLENSAAVQAATCKTLGVTGANFWTDAGGKVGGIQCSGKAAILVHEQDGKLSVGVADPTQLGKMVEVSLVDGVTKTLKLDEGIKVAALNPLKLSIKLEKSDGKTFKAEFQK